MTEAPSPFVLLMNSCWSKCHPDADNRISGSEVRPILQQTGLDDNILRQIWSMVDKESLGKVTFVQLGYLLGLASQQQRGAELNISVLDGTSPPPMLFFKKKESSLQMDSQASEALGNTIADTSDSERSQSQVVTELERAVSSEQSLHILSIPVPSELTDKIESLKRKLQDQQSSKRLAYDESQNKPQSVETVADAESQDDHKAQDLDTGGVELDDIPESIGYGYPQDAVLPLDKESFIRPHPADLYDTVNVVKYSSDDDEDSHDSVEDHLRSSSASSTSNLNVSAATAATGVFVELQVDQRGTGLVFGGAKNDARGAEVEFGVYIKAIKPNTVAAECGTIVVGMQVLLLNGYDLSNRGTFNILSEALLASPTLLKIVLSRNTSLFDAYLTRRKALNLLGDVSGNQSVNGTSNTSMYAVAKPAAIPSDSVIEAGSLADLDPSGVTSNSSALVSTDYHTIEEIFSSLPAGPVDRSNQTVTEIDLHLDERGPGIVFSGSADEKNIKLRNQYGIFIKSVKPNSAAGECDLIVPGMQVLSVNGLSLEAKGTFVQLREGLARTRGGMLTLALRSNSIDDGVSNYASVSKLVPMTSDFEPAQQPKPNRPSSAPSTIRVDLNLNGRGSGLIFGGAKNVEDAVMKGGFGVFIKSIKPESVASECGIIKPQMQVLELNGVDLSTDGTFVLLREGLANVNEGLLSLVLTRNQVQPDKNSIYASASQVTPKTSDYVYAQAAHIGPKDVITTCPQNSQSKSKAPLGAPVQHYETLYPQEQFYELLWPAGPKEDGVSEA